jgi:hypothetical protein
MKYLILTLVLVTALVTMGCVNTNQAPVTTPARTTALPVSTPVITPVMTTVQTTEPTPELPTERKITDGFWCRDATRNIGKDPTDVRECYQFFTDGTYQWGFSPGRPMGKSLSCSGDPQAKCVYSIAANGQYEVQGGYFYTLSGDALIDPHDPPYFMWSSTGIP